jgi:ATP-dependent Clp protease ATP-binding subunit ClpA
VLGPLDCTIEELVAELDALVPQGSAAPEGTLPFAATTKGVLTQAFQEATARQDRHIGCEHLLLAVVERGGTASAAMFETHGATHSAMRAALGGGGDGPASFQVRTTKGVGRFRRSSKGAS